MRVEDFFDFVFFHIIDNDRRWFVGLLLGMEFGWFLWGEKGFVEHGVNLFPSGRESKTIG